MQCRRVPPVHQVTPKTSSITLRTLRTMLILFLHLFHTCIDNFIFGAKRPTVSKYRKTNKNSRHMPRTEQFAA